MLTLLIAAAAAFHLQENGRDVDFTYDWPAQASAIPSLKTKLRSDLQRDRLRTAKNAGEDRRMAGTIQGGYAFHQHEFSRAIEFAGQSGRLASFEDNVGSFTGGAHPNSGTSALLWDRASAKEVKFKNLFTRSPTPILQPSYCKDLAAERKEKLGNDVPDSTIWERCPDPLTLAVVPTDMNGNGRFERLVVTASPYAVGSYAEGEYVVTLPVTRALIQALKPEYRASFEVQPQ